MKAILLVFLILCHGCHHAQQIIKYEGNVGETAFDPKVDDKDFTLCNENWTGQYFHFTSNSRYIDRKAFIDSVFFYEFRANPSAEKENGLIRIRFIVNCKGETGRFRVLAIDPGYKEKTFHESIVSQLLRITKGLRTWQIQKMNNAPADYYQYLIFKIVNGQLTEIMP